ncbi:hypothetical protein SNL152K_8751 [Streptomyces sp. NL15-2K]|nr:hypothetical protein SNL152K_8751 [Streptomyces sp. NL15-2K]
MGTPRTRRPSPCGVRRTIRRGSASGAVSSGQEDGNGSLRGIRDRGCCEDEGVPEHDADHCRRVVPRRTVFRGAGPHSGRDPCGDHTRPSVTVTGCSMPPPALGAPPRHLPGPLPRNSP